MANIRIMFPNEADDAAITVSPAAVSTLPITSLQTRPRGYIWRSTDLSSQAIKGDWTSPKTLGGMVLNRHNLTAAGTVRLRLWNNTGQSGTLLYDSTAIALGTTYAWGSFAFGLVPWGGTSIFDSWAYRAATIWFVSAAITTARSFQLDVTDVGNPWGYMEASRLYMGPVFSPATNMERPMEIGWNEETPQFRTAGASLRSDQTKTPYRQWNLKWGYLVESERAQLFEITRRAGKRQDLFVSGFPEEGSVRERDYAGVVKFTVIPTLTNIQVDAAKFEAPLTIQET